MSQQETVSTAEAVAPQAPTAPAPKQGLFSKVWQSAAMKPVRVSYDFAKAVTSPIWVPEKYLIVKPAAWLWKRTGGFGKTVAATYGLTASAAFLGAVLYGASYGYVASMDVSVPGLNWPASTGSWTGHIIRLSHKGSFPCDSWEGVIQTGGVTTDPNSASTNAFSFSIRKFQGDIIEQVQAAHRGNQLVTLNYKDSGIEQSSFDNNSLLACIQHTDHTPVSITAVPAPTR